MSTRRIVFTKNNWTEEDYRALWEEPKFSYLVMGKEVGENGTPHLQGYAEFFKKAKYAALAKKHKMACFVAKTQKEAIEYCKKDGDWAEKGEPRKDAQSGGQIEKDRWARNLELAKQGKLEELSQIDPEAYTRCYKTYKQIKTDHMQPKEEVDLDNAWLWGPPGIGKSSSARKTAGGVYYPKQLNKWWDGYQGEDFVIIDDWEKDCHLEHHLKIWADRYDFIAETKGGAIRIRPKHIIVTSNYSMEQCFNGEVLAAMRRRFNVHHFDKLI